MIMSAMDLDSTKSSKHIENVDVENVSVSRSSATKLPAMPIVNEEGDASNLPIHNDPADNRGLAAITRDFSPLSLDSIGNKRNHLGAYKHFARTANRTLTSFTNEMSEILRQSIERLDNISMKVRGCVYEIERQRVGIPGFVGLDLDSKVQNAAADAIESTQMLCATGSTNKVQTKAMLKEIEEDVSLWRRREAFVNAPPRGDKKSDLDQIQEEEITEPKVKQKRSAKPSDDESVGSPPKGKNEGSDDNLLNYTQLQLQLLKQQINEKSPKGSPKLTPIDGSRTTTAKRNATHIELSSSACKVDETQVMHKINKQNKNHRRAQSRRRERDISTDDADDQDQPGQQLVDADASDQQLEKLRERYETRPRRRHRKHVDSRANASTQPPPHHQKRATHQNKMVNEAYVNENYNDNLWFGPKLSSSGPSKRSIKSVRSIKTPTKHSKDNSTHVLKMVEYKNTKLARKFGNSNFHDPSLRDVPSKVESYTGGRLVRLTSDSKQDWSVIMHTQKAPTRYELKQNSPFPTNNILDEITLKELEPLKAEYPRRDNMVESNLRIEDTLLYRLVNGDAVSLSCLIDVSTCRADGTANQMQSANAKSKRRRKPPQIPSMPAPRPPTILPTPQQILATQQIHLHRKMQSVKEQKSKHIKQVQANTSELSRGDDKDAQRAGINRSAERRQMMVEKKKTTLEPKKLVISESKRIAARLSEIKNNDKFAMTKAKSISMQDYQVYRQMSKRDARRRLKKYLVDPNKSHMQQQYLVMMVNQIDYDDNDCHELINKNVGGKETSRHEKSVAEFLAPYIHHNDGVVMPVLATEYTVGIVTVTANANAPAGSTSSSVSTNKAGKRYYFEPAKDPLLQYNIRPTRDVDYKPTRMPIRRSAFENMLTNSLTQTGPPSMKHAEDPGAWKHAIRTCYSGQRETRRCPLDMCSTNKPLDPAQVRAIISNMEMQLKQVMENPKIENKSLVIKGLQEEMEWILGNLEGQTTALKRRKAGRKADANVVDKRKVVVEKREPILKPTENIKPLKTSNIITTTTTHHAKPSSPLHTMTFYEHESPIQPNSTSRSLLKRSTASTAIGPDVPADCCIHTQLMNKWQALENPSIESVLIGCYDKQEDKQVSLDLNMDQQCKPEVRKVRSRPETRRETRMSSFASPNRRASTTNSTHNEFQLRANDDDSNESSNRNMLDVILAKVRTANTDKETTARDTLPLSSVSVDPSIYNSCTEIPVCEMQIGTQVSVAADDDGHMTPEEINEYHKNIKTLENQLGEETQRFVDEMDEVIKKIETNQKATVGVTTDSDELLRPFINAVKKYKDEGSDVDFLSIPTSTSNFRSATLLERATQIASITSLRSQVAYMAASVAPVVYMELPEVQTMIAGTDKQTDTTYKPTFKEITLTLSHNMRRHIEHSRKSIAEEQMARSMDSPMMLDIKRGLFGIEQQEPVRGEEDKCYAADAIVRNRMSWEMNDKSTTTLYGAVSLAAETTDNDNNDASEMEIMVTNAEAVDAAEAAVQTLQDQVTTTATQSESAASTSSSQAEVISNVVEMTVTPPEVTATGADESTDKLARIPETESVAKVLPTSLADTLTRQESICKRIQAHYRKSANFLTCVYTLLFTVLIWGLNWNYTCIAN